MGTSVVLSPGFGDPSVVCLRHLHGGYLEEVSPEKEARSPVASRVWVTVPRGPSGWETNI